MIEVEGKYTKASVFVKKIDETTYSQIIQLVNHPTFVNKVAIMPDTHAGASNSVIGFTMPLAKTIIPNTVGVDIGCGMVSAQLSITADDIDFAKVDRKIRQIVPVGNRNGSHKTAVVNFSKDFPFQQASKVLWEFTRSFSKLMGVNYVPVEYNYEWFEKLCARVDVDISKAQRSVGTLGGGNHFIEIGQSSGDSSLWLTVHSGSRMLGNKIARYHSIKAEQGVVEANKRYKAEFEEKKKQLIKEGKETDIAKLNEVIKQKHLLPYRNMPKKMEFLDDEAMYNYFVDMVFAQVYAQENRRIMINNIAKILKIETLDSIESVHNYIDFDDMIIRKGAIRAYKGERMIIPFNMVDGILICEGKSNANWNYSAPHGAGRVLSRSRAKANLSLSEFKAQMEAKGVFSTSVSTATLDEAPLAYKPAIEIEEAISPTANILFRLKPLYNLKGGN